MKQSYFFLLVCLCLLLTSQLCLGQASADIADMSVRRVRSSSTYKNDVKSVQLLNYSAGECDNSDDFGSMSEKVYSDLTTPNGWYASYAERYDDFVCLFGVLKSPVFTNGCNSISFKYAKDDWYNDGYPSFTVEILKETEGVWSTAWTETISNPAAEELVFNEVSFDRLKIEGNVQLVVTRLSPNSIVGSPPQGDVPDVKDFCLSDYVRDTILPTAPADFAAQPGLTTVSLSWTASTDNISVEGYNVYLNGDSVNTLTNTSCVVTGLKPGTGYTFEVAAFDDDKNNSEKVSVVSTTLADNIAPTDPENLIGVSKNCGMIISWTASNDNVGVEKYNVYAGGTLVGSSAGTTDTIVGLADDTDYLFEVEAEDISGNKSGKVSKTISTTIDKTAPVDPSNLQANAVDDKMILTWTASTDNFGVAKYNIYLDGELAGATTANTDTVKGLSPDTEYKFEVEAEDASGNKSGKALVLESTPADNVPPTKPGDFVAEATEVGVVLSWTASTDNFEVAKYNVYANGDLVFSTSQVKDTITGLATNADYLIEIEAEDASGNKSEKASADVSGESIASLTFSNIKSLTVNRTRSASDYSPSVRFYDLFNYPSVYGVKTKISEVNDIAISYSSTNEDHLLFNGYYYHSTRGQYFYYKIPAVAYGTDTLAVTINYRGYNATALIIANVAPLSAVDDSYTIDIGETLEMNVASNDGPSAYLDKTSLEVLQNTSFGSLTNNNNGTLSYINESSTPNYSVEKFEYRIADTEGHYDTATVNISIHKNAYASRVIEFLPAPGQFTNESIGQSTSAEKTIGTQDGMISLGAFGGYVIYGFDQPIVNNPQNPYGVDFSVKGNSFAAALYGAWTEPAAVRVMQDKNGDGIPNDGEWYELAGSDYYMSSTQKNVKMTYYNPHYNERYTVPWKKDNGETGALLSNAFHSHSYYPDPFDFGCNRDSVTYEGSIIKSSLDMSTPSYIEFYRAPFFGYCDNRGNSSDLTDPQNPYFADGKGSAADGFDLSWAVDKDGQHVDIDSVDFVKIYTGGFANAGWLGEWSSEVRGVGITTPDPDYVPEDYYINYIGITQLKVLKGQTCQFEGFLFKNGVPQTEGTQQWSTSNTSVGTVDNTGLFTAVADGETYLRFSQKSDIATDSIRLLVVELEGVHLEIEGNTGSADSTELIRGETISITAQGLDNISDVVNGSTSNRFTYDTYTWTTSDPEIGTIDNGLFTGKKVGRTMVHAYSNSDPTLSDSMIVIVNEIPELEIVSNPIKLAYNDPVGEKTIEELFTTETNATVYLDSVYSKTGLGSPAISSNVLTSNFTDGVYGVDTFSFNVTWYKKDTTIDIAFIFEPDAYGKEEQVLFVNNSLKNNPDKSSLVSYIPGLDSIIVVDGELDAYSVTDVLVDGAFAFVSGETFLSKYNLTNYEQESTIDVDLSGNCKLAVCNNLLLVAEKSGLEIYYKSDLAFCKKISFEGKISGLKVVGDKAYVFLSNETTKELATVAVVGFVEGEIESEKSLVGAGIIVSDVLVKGTKLYVSATASGSGNAAVVEYDTESSTYSVLTANNSFENTLSSNAVIKGDSIFIPAGEGFVAFNVSTKVFGADTLMKPATGFYPTSIAYHDSLSEYFVSYSNVDRTESKGLVFAPGFAKVAGFDSVGIAPAFMKTVNAIENNSVPEADLSLALSNYNTYEKATGNTSIYIYDNRFTDADGDFTVYTRYLEHVPWLTWNTSYSSTTRKRYYARFTGTVDKDSVITVPVDAIDKWGFSATRTFNVTIKPRIYKPVLENPIADTIVAANCEDIQIPLSYVFSNTSSSGVTFGMAVSKNTNTGLAAISISGNQLTISITQKMTGEATITVRDSAKHSTYGVKYVEATFKVAVVDNEPPSVPGDLEGRTTETQISLSWDSSTDNVGVVGYVVYLEGDSVNTVTGTTFAIDSLDAATKYTVEVAAFDRAGNKSGKAGINVSTTDETAPSVPENLTAVPSKTTVALSWDASTDNISVMGYNIYVNGRYKTMVSGRETSYTVEGLAPATEYSFSVEARDDFGNRAKCSPITVSTTDGETPTSPGNLSAVPAETSISLTWTASTDNIGVTGYIIYINGDSVSTVTETNFTATDLEEATGYSFEVEAFDADGNRSEKAEIVQGTTITLLTPVSTATEDEEYTYAITASYVNSLSYELGKSPEGMEISGNIITWTPTEGVLYADVSVIVGNGFFSDTLSYTIDVTPVNDAPVITSTPDLSANENVVYVYEVTATDAEGSTLVYSLKNEPEGMAVQSNKITWAPPKGTLTSGKVTLLVSDGELVVKQRFIISVTSVGAEQATFKMLAAVDGNLINPASINYSFYKIEGNGFTNIQYRAVNSGDTAVFTVEPGKWIIRGNPAGTSTFLATYVGDVTEWGNAEAITIANKEEMVLSLNCIATPEIKKGKNKIYGYVYQDFTAQESYIEKSAKVDGKDPLEDAMVHLFYEDYTVPFGATQTDDEGFYQFSGLPEGNYSIHVDIPGFGQNAGCNVIFDDENSAGEESVSFTANFSTSEITGSEKLGQDNTIMLYPNPTNGIVNVALGNVPGKTGLIVYNATGQIVVQETYYGPVQISLDLSNHVNGIYLVRVITDGSDNISKVILKK